MNETAIAPAIRATPASVTADWLTDVLRHAGHRVTVTGFRATNVGTGQVGQNVRFDLDYGEGAGAGGTAPVSIVGKFASDDPESRQTGIALLNYLREVRFYQQLRPTLDIQTPEVLFTDVDPDTHDFVLVMEDLAPARQGDQLAGCDAEAASLALAQLARLHGPRWNDASLRELDWIGGVDADAPNIALTIWTQVFAGFEARYAERLGADDLALARALGDRMEAYTSARSPHFTVTHGDYRLDNMLFGGRYPLAVVDWQSPALGLGTADAAYFMGTGLEAPERRLCESDLLRAYHGALVDYGVDDYDFDACWRDYRRSSFAGLVMAVIASMIVGQTERGDEMFMTMARRSAAMARDLDALDAL